MDPGIKIYKGKRGGKERSFSMTWRMLFFGKQSKKGTSATGPHGSDSVEETGQLATDTPSSCGHSPRHAACPVPKSPSSAVQRHARETELTVCASQERLSYLPNGWLPTLLKVSSFPVPVAPILKYEASS